MDETSTRPQRRQPEGETKDGTLVAGSDNVQQQHVGMDSKERHGREECDISCVKRDNDERDAADGEEDEDDEDDDEDECHHAGGGGDDDSPASYEHQCYICDKTFSANSNLNRHLRKIHKENVQSPYNNVRCALCESLFSSSSMYTDHLEKDHKVAIVTERLNFKTRELFEDWKHSVENETTAQFIKSRGEKRTKNVNKTYYSCNRSGYFVSKARTQKALKKQGSRKINGRCPASMNVTVNENGSYDVRFIKTHVGHGFELKHLDLSEKDRDLIVRKLTSGVTKREIIRQIRSTTELHQNCAAATSSAVSPAASVISSSGVVTAGVNTAQPIVINSRSSIPGCSEQQIEVVVSAIDAPVIELATATGRTNEAQQASATGGEATEVKTDENTTTTATITTANTIATISATPQAHQPISRLHLATTKDIHNIINSKQLDSKKIRHNYDLNTVDAWVKELRELETEDSNPVLLYKDQSGLIERFPKVRELDFLLIIMKEGQAELLKQLGTRCIVIDSTHQVHFEYLHLTYLSVIDEDDKSLPVAFLFSSRTDLDVLEVFLTLIKERLGGAISTRMLIADDLHDFYQAWWRAMSMPVHNLLTPWHVFESLSKRFDLIKSRDKLRKAKRQLRALLTESEPDKFKSCLEQLLTDYRKDPDTCKFIEFFDEQFAKNPDIWSNCFRKTNSVSNQQLWNLHDKFKLVYKEGKSSRKMCKYITCLMGLFDEQQLERLLQVEAANGAGKRRAIELRHKKGVETGSLVYEVAVEPAYWLCPSECSSEVYDEVRLNSSEEEEEGAGAAGKSCATARGSSTRGNGAAGGVKVEGGAGEAEGGEASCKRGSRGCCDLVCPECQTCRHEYKCTCLDYVVGLNMCKHIHRISALCKQD